MSNLSLSNRLRGHIFHQILWMSDLISKSWWNFLTVYGKLHKRYRFRKFRKFVETINSRNHLDRIHTRSKQICICIRFLQSLDSTFTDFQSKLYAFICHIIIIAAYSDSHHGFWKFQIYGIWSPRHWPVSHWLNWVWHMQRPKSSGSMVSQILDIVPSAIMESR